MSFAILQLIEDWVVKIFGGYAVAAMIVLFIVALVLLIVQIDFRIVSFLELFLITAFSHSGWIPSWIEPVCYIIIVGFGVYIFYDLFSKGF